MKLIVLVGLPGSGKSTWLKQQGITALSSDSMRELLTGDAGNQQVNRLVFRTLRYLTLARARAGAEVTYIDSTALTGWERARWIEWSQRFGFAIEALYFDTPVEECRRRNRLRERVVPEAAMERMVARMSVPELAEGFSRVATIAGMPATPQPE